MAIKIPDSPEIIGSEPVLRQGSNIRGVSVIPNFKVDTSAERKALQDIGDAWALYEEDQNATYLTAWKSDFVKFASATATDIENGHKGRQAKDLYNNIFEGKINQWVEDRLGPNKDDGQIRIANDGLKQRVLNWVDSQKISWINHFADYEANEFNKYRKTVFDANDQANSNLVLSARTDEEIGNAIQGMYQTARIQYQGMDNRYIANIAAKKADEAVSAYVSSMISSDPYSAAVRVKNIDGRWTNASEALTSASRAKLMDEIQKSYVKNGANNYALADSDTARLEVLDASIISELWDTGDPLIVERVQDQIRAEGEKIRSAREKETEGLRAREMSNLVTQFNNAKTVDDLWSVMQTAVESGHPEAAKAFQDVYVDKLDMLKTVDDAMSIDPGWEEKYQRYYKEEAEKERAAITEEQRRIEQKYLLSGTLDGETEKIGVVPKPRSMLRKDVLTREEIRTLDNIGGANDRRIREAAARRATERALGSPTYASLAGSDVEADKLLMAKQDADRAAFEKYHNMLEARKSAMPSFTEMYSEQALGVPVNPADPRFAALPADLRRELMLQRQTVTDYQRLVDRVPEVDTILKEVPGYSKMSQASQGVLKRFIIEKVERASTGPGATGVPTGEALRQLVLSSAANAMVPEEEKLRNAINRNSQYDRGWDVDFQDAESALVYSAVGKDRSIKNNTYTKQRELAGKIIDDFASSLDRNPRKVVQDMREDMIQWIIDGNYDQVIYFVRGFSNKDNM